VQNLGLSPGRANWRELIAGQGFEQLYAGAPEAQKAQLLDFRESHPGFQAQTPACSFLISISERPM